VLLKRSEKLFTQPIQENRLNLLVGNVPREVFDKRSRENIGVVQNSHSCWHLIAQHLMIIDKYKEGTYLL